MMDQFYPFQFIPQDLLLHNGKVASNQSQPHTSLYGYHLYGYPFPFLPNLNIPFENPPLRDFSHENSISCPPCPPTPVTQMGKRAVDYLPRKNIDQVDETVPFLVPLVKESHHAEQLAPLQSEAAAPNSVTESVAEVYPEKQLTEFLTSRTSKSTCEQPSQVGVHSSNKNQGIDLNKTPPQKARRKKYMPKVIKQGKPRTPLKPRTPKPAAPAPPNNNGKWKYVRRKKVEHVDTTSSAAPEVLNQDDGCHVKAVKRCLNFDLDSALSTDHTSASTVNPACRGTVTPQDGSWRDVVRNSSTPSSRTAHFTREPETFSSLSSEGVAFDLNTSLNLMPGGSASLSGVSNNEPLRNKMTGMYQNLSGTGNTMAQLQQPSRRAKIRQNLKDLAKKEQTRLASYRLDGSLSDVLATGMKANQSSFQNSPSSSYINIIFNEMNKVSTDHEYRRFGPNPTDPFKKRRTDEHAEARTSSTTGNSVPMIQTPPRNWNSYQMLTNSTGYTLADARVLLAQQRMKASQDKSSFGQIVGHAHTRPTEPVVTHARWTDAETSYCNERPASENPYGDSTNINQESARQLSRSSMKDRKTLDGAPYGGSFFPTSLQKMEPNVHEKEGRNEVTTCMPFNANLQRIQEAALSCDHGASLGCKSVPAAASKRRKSRKNSSPQTSPTDDCQSGYSFQGQRVVHLHSQVMTTGEDIIKHIILRLMNLDINKEYENDQAQNALVAYNGVKFMVPYEPPLVKKRRPRVKVVLDEETNREWNLLMGKENVDGEQRMDKEKEKYWEDERDVFCKRSESFIDRMHLVQGDRRFSPWKGSVVDSVVGVFLTQNVSDHLSSSAFMMLASRFPVHSNGNENQANNNHTNKEQASTRTHDSNGYVIISDDDINCKETMSSQETSDASSTMTDEVQQTERKELMESRSAAYSHSSIEDGKKSVGNESPESTTRLSFGSSTEVQACLTGSSNYADTNYQQSPDDPLSSENSVVSSQNSSDYIFQTSQASGTPTRNEDLAIDSMFHLMESSSNTFTELLEIATRRTLLHHSGRIRQLASEDGEERSASSNRGYLSIPFASMSNPSRLHPQDFMSQPSLPSLYHIEHSLNSTLLHRKQLEVGGTRCNMPTPSSVMSLARSTNSLRESSTKTTDQEALPASGVVPVIDAHSHSSKHPVAPTFSRTESLTGRNSLFNQTQGVGEVTSLGENIPHLSPKPGNWHRCNSQLSERTDVVASRRKPVDEIKVDKPKNKVIQVPSKPENNNDKSSKAREPEKTSPETQNNQNLQSEGATVVHKGKRRTASKKDSTFDWDVLRRQVCRNEEQKTRNSTAMDSLDYEAMTQADVKEVSETIRERGMNNMLAARIKAFLDRVARDHGSIDLEWLRDVPPDQAKDYLLSIRGLGLKSVECVRLLTLHHKAFPVDTNVGRICVRLGWVPLQPLPESLQLHLLEMYPVLETIQKYLWPRLCKLDQRTLYELHYQMITFGKVFCTKSKPNCNACPMRGECKHFASAFASTRLALPGIEEKGLVSSTITSGSTAIPKPIPRTSIPQLTGQTNVEEGSATTICEPIIEEPATPEPDLEAAQSAIDEAFYEDPDEIPTIKLNYEALRHNLESYVQENGAVTGENDILSQALVLLSPEAASIPVPKLKNVSRLRTEHQVYELPDSHPLLEGFDRRESDDPCSYLLAIWTPGETAQSKEQPKIICNAQETGGLCDEITCFPCNSKREADKQVVRGTIMIPCRTAMRGSFPLNGTYFQVNEVFADHATSYCPIYVPRSWIWTLPRRTVYIGTSVPTIFKGLTTEGIQHCFWRGYVCVRGFDRTTRAPRPLFARLHYPASKEQQKRISR